MGTSNPGIVAVGDVHGEVEALREILRDATVLGDQDQWVGGKTIVVQTGDVIDRGPDSLGAYTLLQKLQREAAEAGGAVVRLVGNHELALLQGEDYMTDIQDWPAFRHRLEQDVLAGKVQGAYVGEGYLFTHAGVRSEMREHLLAGHEVRAGDDLAQLVADTINRTLVEAVRNNDFADNIFRVGRRRGGEHRVGGIFWEDASGMFASLSAGALRQVFGHTPVRGMRISPSAKRVDIDAGLHCYRGRAYLTVRKGRVTAQR
jgi:hypothetical protein